LGAVFNQRDADAEQLTGYDRDVRIWEATQMGYDDRDRGRAK